MEERRSLIQWIKEHKTQLTVAGVSVGVLLMIVLGLKNREAIKAFWSSLHKTIAPLAPTPPAVLPKVTTDVLPGKISEAVNLVTSDSNVLSFEVAKHVRNLPEGWHASPEKISTALENGILLVDGQTWVKGYLKGGLAA